MAQAQGHSERGTPIFPVEQLNEINPSGELKSHLQQIKDTILAECKTETDFTELCLSKGWNYEEAWKIVELLKHVGDVIEPRPGRVMVLE